MDNSKAEEGSRDRATVLYTAYSIMCSLDYVSSGKQSDKGKIRFRQRPEGMSTDILQGDRVVPKSFSTKGHDPRPLQQV